MKEIEMISYSTVEGKIKPIRFRLVAEDETLIVVKIDRILYQDENPREDNVKYRCEVVIQGLKYAVDLYYYKTLMKWYLNI